LVDRKGDGQLCPLADGVLTVDELWLGDREVRPPLLVAVGAVSSQFVDTTLAVAIVAASTTMVTGICGDKAGVATVRTAWRCRDGHAGLALF